MFKRHYAFGVIILGIETCITFDSMAVMLYRQLDMLCADACLNCFQELLTLVTREVSKVFIMKVKAFLDSFGGYI